MVKMEVGELAVEELVMMNLQLVQAVMALSNISTEEMAEMVA